MVPQHAPAESLPGRHRALPDELIELARADPDIASGIVPTQTAPWDDFTGQEGFSVPHANNCRLGSGGRPSFGGFSGLVALPNGRDFGLTPL
jgi:hypothetical protein